VLQTDTIWIPSQSPVIIDKPIDVKPWVGLTIQAGVSVIFTSQDAGLRIYGKLIHLVKHPKHNIVRGHISKGDFNYRKEKFEDKNRQSKDRN